ncbi:MAG TPA: cation diffusion facilitator family transporter [Bacteroidota bacterium]|nr:cation diffusion facilitator family transporter [Bacteroidota bacterium]
MSGTREKKTIAVSSVIAAVFLTSFKLGVGLWTNSLGILSEAAHSGLDLLAAIVTLVAVSYADRPADEDHPYGHGRLENISALVETLLLVATCAWIMFEAVERLLMHTHHVETTVWSFIVMGTSIAIDVSRSRALYRVAKRTNSQALEADALHFSSDVWSSLAVIAGLIFVWMGYPEFDAVAALLVAVVVLSASYRLGKRAIDALMDRIPKTLFEKIQNTIQTVEGVEEVRSMRIHSSGSHYFIDTTVAIERTLPFQSAHAIMDRIEKSVREIELSADVVVHAEPFESAGETVLDKIRMIVVNAGLRPPHNLEVHVTEGKYFIDFDIEYQKGLSFAEAHEIATTIEKHIQQKLSPVGKVTIHMEEIEIAEHSLMNVTETELQLSSGIRTAVEQHPDVAQCIDLTLLQEGMKYHVACTCRIEKTKTLDEVHQIISEVEANLFRRFKQIRRVTIHAEPK